MSGSDIDGTAQKGQCLRVPMIYNAHAVSFSEYARRTGPGLGANGGSVDTLGTVAVRPSEARRAVDAGSCKLSASSESLDIISVELKFGENEESKVLDTHDE